MLEHADDRQATVRDIGLSKTDLPFTLHSRTGFCLSALSVLRPYYKNSLHAYTKVFRNLMGMAPKLEAVRIGFKAKQTGRSIAQHSGEQCILRIRKMFTANTWDARANHGDIIAMLQDSKACGAVRHIRLFLGISTLIPSPWQVRNRSLPGPGCFPWPCMHIAGLF